MKRTITDAILAADEGALAVAGRELRTLIDRVLASEKPGNIVLSISVRPAESGTVAVKERLSTTAPEVDGGEGLTTSTRRVRLPGSIHKPTEV